MVTSTASAYPISASRPELVATTTKGRRRQIDVQSGHALEILGHSIEYLADEYVHDGGSFSAHDASVEAMQQLMAINRQIYYACPFVPTFSERCRAFFHL